MIHQYSIYAPKFIKEGCLAETLDIWQGIHPSIITLAMQWEYEMPPKKPAESLSKFIAGIKEILHSKSF